MRMHKSKLDRLNKSLRSPEMITLTALYSDGHMVAGLPLDAELGPDAAEVRIFNGDKPLSAWWLADLWQSL